jgi:hypothetical protein
LHKLFWVALRRFWSGWTKPLVLVTPRTVVSWHRAGLRLYLDMGFQSQASSFPFYQSRAAAFIHPHSLGATPAHPRNPSTVMSGLPFIPANNHRDRKAFE